MDVNQSRDPDGLRCFYYLVQVTSLSLLLFPLLLLFSPLPLSSSSLIYFSPLSSSLFSPLLSLSLLYSLLSPLLSLSLLYSSLPSFPYLFFIPSPLSLLCPCSLDPCMSQDLKCLVFSLIGLHFKIKPI